MASLHFDFGLALEFTQQNDPNIEEEQSNEIIYYEDKTNISLFQNIMYILKDAQFQN